VEGIAFQNKLQVIPQSPPLGSSAAELRILKAMELTTIFGKTPDD